LQLLLLLLLLRFQHYQKLSDQVLAQCGCCLRS
jgi:hypothetical protein